MLMMFASADDIKLESLLVFQQQSTPASLRKMSLAMAVTMV